MQSKVALVLLLAAFTTARQLKTPNVFVKRQDSYCPSSQPTDCGEGCCDADEECQEGDNGITGCCPEGETCTGDAPPPFESFSIPSISIPDFSDFTDSYDPDDYTSYLPTDFTFTSPPTVTPSGFDEFLSSLSANQASRYTSASGPEPTFGGDSGNSGSGGDNGGNGGGLGIQAGPAGAGNALRPLAQPVALAGAAAALGGYLL